MGSVVGGIYFDGTAALGILGGALQMKVGKQTRNEIHSHEGVNVRLDERGNSVDQQLLKKCCATCKVRLMSRPLGVILREEVTIFRQTFRSNLDVL